MGDPTPKYTTSGAAATRCDHEFRGDCSSRPGSREHVGKGGDQGGNPKIGPICKQFFCNPQKRGQSISTYNKLKRNEQIHPISPFQDGGPERCKKSAKERGLDVQTRSERCLLFDPSQPSIEETGEVQVEGNPIRVPLLGIRSGPCTENIHKTPESPHKHPQKTRDKTGNIPGRHLVHGDIQGKLADGQGLGFIPVSPPGFNYKPKEVGTSPNAKARISRDSSRQLEDDILVVTGEGSKAKGALSNNSEVTHDFYLKTMFSDRETEINISRGHPSTASAEIPPTGVYSSSTGEVSLRNTYPYPQRGASGTEVVDPKLGNTKGKSPTLTPSRNDHLLGCSKDGGLGSSVSFRIDRGDVDEGRSQPEHKHSGITGSRTSNKNLYKGGKAKVHPHKDRQHHCTIIPSKNGGGQNVHQW